MFASSWLGAVLLIGLVHFLDGEKFYPDGYDSNCRLDGQTMYPWLVRIWDTTLDVTMSHGTVISYLAVLTVCSPFTYSTPVFKNIPGNYELIGTKIFDVRKDPTHTCTQKTTCREIISHPKCRTHEIWVSTLFDFAIFFLDSPFKVDSYTFPAAPSPITARRFLTDVLNLNYMTKPICEVVHFADHKQKNALLKSNPYVANIVYPEPCTELYCEVEGKDGDPEEEKHQDWKCMEMIAERANGTIICAKPTWTTHIPRPTTPPIYDYLPGASYTCNGTVFGQVVETKHREVYKTDKHDFFLIATYLRVWPWITVAKERFGAAWIKAFYVEELKLGRQKFDPPAKAEIKDQKIPSRTPVRPKISVNPILLSRANSPEFLFGIFSWLFSVVACFVGW